MRVVTQKYLDALRSGCEPYFRVDLYDNGQVIMSSANDPSSPAYLPVEDGNVVVDRTARHRREASFVIPDDRGIYAGDSRLSTRSGNEFKISRGIRFFDGSIETFSQGMFGISDRDCSDESGSLLITIRGADRSRRIRRNVFTTLYRVAHNQSLVVEAQKLINDRLGFVPNYVVTPDASNFTSTFKEYSVGEDPWEAVQAMMTAVGYEVFFGPEGELVIQPIPEADLSGTPTFRYEEGEYGTLQSVEVQESNEFGYNGVVAIGQSTYGITPATAAAWDTDPESETYSGYNPTTGTFGFSKYGRYPKILEPNPDIKTTAQASIAAGAALREYLGRPLNVTFLALVNPAHVEGDLIQVHRPRAGLQNNFLLLDQFELPFRATEGMAVRTKELQG